MKIAKKSVATIHYTLTDDDKTVIDTSDGGDPLPYLHGAGNLIPGLEEELEGRVAGDAFQVRIPPERAYGLRDANAIRVVPREHLPEGEIEVGMQFQAQSDQGTLLVTIAQIEGDQITLDANHPLAGLPLNFDVTIVEVREATAEELAHGHVHGAGGHDH